MRCLNVARVALAIFGIVAPVVFSKASDLTLVVDGVGPSRGDQAALCTREEYRGLKCRYSQREPARKQSVTLRFENIENLTYSVAVFHDLHGDGRLHRSFLVIPEEGVGFSRNPLLVGREAFAQTAFGLHGNAAMKVKLRFEPTDSAFEGLSKRLCTVRPI